MAKFSSSTNTLIFFFLFFEDWPKFKDMETSQPCLVPRGLGGHGAHSPAHYFLTLPKMEMNLIPCVQYLQKIHTSTSYIGHKLPSDINLYPFVHVDILSFSKHATHSSTPVSTVHTFKYHFFKIKINQ